MVDTSCVASTTSCCIVCLRCCYVLREDLETKALFSSRAVVLVILLLEPLKLLLTCEDVQGEARAEKDEERR